MLRPISDQENLFMRFSLTDQLEILLSISRKQLHLWEDEHLEVCRTIGGGC